MSRAGARAITIALVCCLAVAGIGPWAATATSAGSRCAATPPSGARIGTASNDNLVGTAGNDVIFGMGGHDRLDGRGGDDLLCGGPGNDWIDGGDGADELSGGDGNDQILGGNGADVISGDAGNDQLSGGAGADTLDGGSGSNSLNGGSSSQGGIADRDRCGNGSASGCEAGLSGTGDGGSTPSGQRVTNYYRAAFVGSGELNVTITTVSDNGQAPDTTKIVEIGETYEWNEAFDPWLEFDTTNQTAPLFSLPPEIDADAGFFRVTLGISKTDTRPGEVPCERSFHLQRDAGGGGRFEPASNGNPFDMLFHVSRSGTNFIAQGSDACQTFNGQEPAFYFKQFSVNPPTFPFRTTPIPWGYNTENRSSFTETVRETVRFVAPPVSQQSGTETTITGSFDLLGTATFTRALTIVRGS